MPHVDDGTLHALLDGALRAEDPARADVVEAHLDTCPDCRALRDQAAVLRAGAANILRALEPDARPDFQEVLTRAGYVAADADADADAPIAARSAARRRGRARTTRAFAWAATIVLALGTGYLMRDLVGPEPTAMARSEADRPAPDTDGGRAGESDADPPDVAPDRARRADQPSVAEGRTTLRETRAPAEPLPRPGPQTRAALDAADPADALDAADATDVAAATGAAAATEEAVVTEEAVTLDIPAASVALAGETVTQTVERTAPAAAPSRFVPRQATDAPAATDRSIVLRGGSVMATREDSMVGQARLETDGWTTATLAEARAVMDGTVYVLPGAEIVRILVRDAEIRTLQQVDGGIQLRVTQRHARDGGPLGAPVPAGAAGVRMRADVDAAERAADQGVARALHDRFWIIVAGPIPAGAIQVLADRARPLDDEPRQR